jgi:hypothetical protein
VQRIIDCLSLKKLVKWSNGLRLLLASTIILEVNNNYYLFIFDAACSMNWFKIVKVVTGDPSDLPITVAQVLQIDFLTHAWYESKYLNGGILLHSNLAFHYQRMKIQQVYLAIADFFDPFLSPNQHKGTIPYDWRSQI